ncbi:unnamed protein product [Coffea canephora]|uniref:Glycosyltransferase n=1 Tax=Coffea canephora TaxID=49390 RepID=A0A068TXP7_COFCA|nr:unnamed protein product [Coffea canephora]
MGSIAPLEKKPHAVCVPAAAQGHIGPMLNLAKLLHHNGFHITFVNTEFNHRRLLKSRAIPDGLPPSDVDATQDVPTLCESMDRTCLGPFRELLAELNDTSSSKVPPVSCIVSDAVTAFTLAAAEELSIPEVLFWTASACSYLGYFQYAKLMEKGIIPLKDASYLTNGYLDTVLDWIPELEGIRLKDLPSFLRTTNPDDFMVKFVLQETQRARKASAIIINTYQQLEHGVLDALSSYLPPIYTIGPLHFLDNHVHDKSLTDIQSNLWKEEPECLEWLDSKDPNSVVYVNFGSIAVMTPEQLVEFAWAPDLLIANETFCWCPQEKVLSHPAVGGFLTHSGWNSTIESISYGVPMICWPFFADQQTNCWFCCTKWGIGMEIDNNVKRDDIESLVSELMAGEKGKEMKKKAMDRKKLAEMAVTDSNSNLENLIQFHNRKY